MKFKTKKIMCAALSLTMAGTIAASQIITYASESNRYNTASNDRVQSISFRNVTGELDLSDIVNKNLSNNVIDYGEEEAIRNITGQNATKTVMISLKTDSISKSKGDDMTVAEYLDTATGQKALRAITESQNKLLADIAAAGIAYKEVARYTTVLNAVAIEVNLSHFNKIRKLNGVSMAGISKTYAAPSAVDIVTNYSKIYGTGIYDSTDYLDEYSGKGITVAILDTGLDYTHEAFSYDPEGEVKFEKSYIVDKINAGGLEAARRTPGLTADDVYLSAKVPFAYDYSDNDTDVYPSYSQHGVHVAGIVAGKADTYVNKDGEVVGGVNDGVFDFMGVAPNAQLVICKVFTDDLESDDLGGANSEDIISALDDCVTLGVDIINMSLGTTSGFSNYEEISEYDQEGNMLKECYENIKKEGISLIAAAGNEFSAGFGSDYGTNLASNPDSGTVGSPSTFVGSMSVASVNGQEAPYMVGNPGENTAYGDKAIYYSESNDANSVPFDFAEEMLGSATSGTFTYLVIPGTGRPGDYSAAVQKRLKPVSEGGTKQPGEKIIVVVKRGNLSFQDKVENAAALYADGIIVYNNVPGTIRMSLQEIKEENRIPSASIDMSAGAALTTDPNNPNRSRSEGTITIDKSLSAGPFMNDYSSWGATPDLKLKPDITSHGGEITSAVAGGYEEMSGTSMATPNLAGLMALVRDYLKQKNPTYNAVQLTTLTNQIVMSSATLLYDEDNLPYSPRKQGAGLATLKNIFETKAYLYTDEANGGAEDNRPKIELGEDEAKKGEYNFTFSVHNFGTSALKFELVSRFFTETLASDGLAVAEAAYMLDDIAPEFTVSGASRSGDVITVDAGKDATISVALKLSAAEKAYIDKSFVNGMYIEGFISLVSQSGEQCDLNLPFMGFYGDWESAPMLDYSAYEMAEIEKDTSIPDEDKPHASIFPTQLYSTYYNGKYAVPMGGFAYLQDEDNATQKVYTEEEHASVSRFNDYYGATSRENYLTSTGIRALYAGLLRNAEVVTYSIYNENTGEEIFNDSKYRIGKGYANGGSARPALIDMKLTPDGLGLINNGKYRIEFNFYMKAADQGTDVSYKNTFSSTFYVDYDAPVLEDARIRYSDYKDGNKIKQKIYLDIDVFDNHYPQAVLLCYESDVKSGNNADSTLEVNLATEYVTPVYNPIKNGTNTVTIEITDIYEKYGDKLYVQIDDYALNHQVYDIGFGIKEHNNANTDPNFTLVTNDRVKLNQTTGQYELELEVNEMYRVELNCGEANASNYTWSTKNGNLIKLKNNEIFGFKETKEGSVAAVTIEDGKGHSQVLNVKVVDKGRTLPSPNVSFGVIQNAYTALEKASGTVEVNAGQTFPLEIETDPWYYPTSEFVSIAWSSSNEAIATVDQNGVVTTNNTRGTADIIARVTLSNTDVKTTAVKLSVQEPFRIESMMLNRYYGSEETVIIPTDKNVMYIGEEAFEDNTTMKRLVIPKTVVEISERAFLNCTALEEVYFINGPTKDLCPDGITSDYPVVDLAKLNIIYADAFSGCTNLRLVDLSNVKVITVARNAFADCTNLETIIRMDKIGIAYDGAFAGCTSLTSIDISGLHTAGSNVFQGCTGLTEVITGHYSAIGEGMFQGCTNLKNITICAPRVGRNAFRNSGLESVTFTNVDANGTWDNTVFRIESNAFSGCSNLTTVNFNGLPASYIGDRAFSGTAITEFTMPSGNPSLGNNIFGGRNVNIDWSNNSGYNSEAGAVYVGTTLVLAPVNIGADFAIRPGTTEIGANAFSGSKLNGINTITIPESVETIGEGAFSGLNLTQITIPSGITVIPANAFARTSLTSITIPSTVTRIEENAFSNTDITEVIFAGTSSLAYIGDYAFSNTKLTKITLPESVKEMGSSVFESCHQLTEAHLSSLTALGDYTFFDCENLTTASFGENAKASGNYTFYAGAYIDWSTGAITRIESSLTSVDLGGLEELGECVFWYCVNLEEIDLKNVTKIGAAAFSDCKLLSKVTNLDKVEYIGANAFSKGDITPETSNQFKHIANLNLASAKEIGDMAFFNVEAANLSIPVAEKIGKQAFAGIYIRELELPATLKVLGAGAFMSAGYLNRVTVAEGNEMFFAENNVVYRNINNVLTGKQHTYELSLYPAALIASGTETYPLHYRVKDGTVSILDWAFAYVNPNSLATVTLPYSLKTIGVSAFFMSSITRINFESIVAPTLLSEYWDIAAYLSAATGQEASWHSMYYANFVLNVVDHYSELGGQTPTTVTIAYPSNGIGYDNFIYMLYSGSVATLGEKVDDNTRAFIELMDGIDVNYVKSLANLPVTEENKTEVLRVSELIKEAHLKYNSAPTSKQIEEMGAERIAKLLEIEEILKPIKPKFGIEVKPYSIELDASSTHKTQYKAGETFDKTGMVLIVTYDDYSTEIITDLSEVILGSAYSGPLTIYRTSVSLEYKGISFPVSITVTAADGTTPPNTEHTEHVDADGDGLCDVCGEQMGNPSEGSGCSGCGTMDIGTTMGGTSLMLLTLAGALLIASKLRRKSDKQ